MQGYDVRTGRTVGRGLEWMRKIPHGDWHLVWFESRELQWGDGVVIGRGGWQA